MDKRRPTNTIHSENGLERQEVGQAIQGDSRTRTEAVNDDSQLDRFPDTEGLGPRRFLGGRVGCVENVNGPGAEICTEFAPTQYELRELAAFWVRKILDIDLFWFQYQSTGSTEWRESVYASRRLARIRAILGDETVSQIEAAVTSELSAHFNSEVWDAFLKQR